MVAERQPGWPQHETGMAAVRQVLEVLSADQGAATVTPLHRDWRR
jgi:hypothetical protein